MRTLKLIVTLVLLVLTPGVSGASPPLSVSTAQGVEHFLHTVYARYIVDGSPPDLDDARAATIYDDSLLALMRADRRALQGEAGVLDADPLCACQDHDIRALNVVVQPGSATRRSATVSFENLGSKHRIQLDLVQRRQGWRITDIHGDNMPSLRAALRDEIHSTAQ